MLTEMMNPLESFELALDVRWSKAVDMDIIMNDITDDEKRRRAMKELIVRYGDPFNWTGKSDITELDPSDYRRHDHLPKFKNLGIPLHFYRETDPADTGRIYTVTCTSFPGKMLSVLVMDGRVDFSEYKTPESLGRLMTRYHWDHYDSASSLLKSLELFFGRYNSSESWEETFKSVRRCIDSRYYFEE